MESLQRSKANAEAKKNAPKKRSLLPKVTMGMGTGYTTLND
jgi:hypothetical protein